MPLPLDAPKMISFSPSVNSTWNNSSSSANKIAFIPLALMFLKADNSVFFTIPRLVANSRYPSVSSFSLKFRIAANLSVSSKFNKLTTGKPLANLDADGIWNALNL